MKKIFYLAIVAIMMMLADTASAQWTDIFSNPGGNSGKAELTTNKVSTIQWETLEQNLGDVKQKVPTLVEFTFTNTGDKPVMILDAEASCGCTKLTFKREPVAPGKPAPDVIIDFNLAAAVCGLGRAGDSGHLIAPKLGPFLRMAFIVTDAPLVCDPPFGATLCDHCGACRNACPGKAIGEEGTDSWQCAVYYRGAHKSNPFMTEQFLAGDPEREKVVEGEKRFDRESARAIYKKIDFLPSRSTGYIPCICGRACDAACYRHLKEKGVL